MTGMLRDMYMYRNEDRAQAEALGEAQKEQANLMRSTADALHELRREMKPPAPPTPAEEAERRIATSRKIPPPIFKGEMGDKPDTHVIRSEDWMDSLGIEARDNKVRKEHFKYTLDGTAREWLRDINVAELSWEQLKTRFESYFSPHGRSIKHQYDTWKSFSFNPDTDDIEEFIRNVKECARCIGQNNEGVLNMIKSCMPPEVYRLLYKQDDLAEMIDMLKDMFAKNPTAARATKVGLIPPFSSVESSRPQQSSQQRKTPPYKPRIAPRRHFTRRGRGNSRFSRGRTPYPRQSRSPGRPRPFNQGRTFRGGRPFRFDRSPTSRRPRENSRPRNRDIERCNYCHERGHWVRECPVRQSLPASNQLEEAWTNEERHADMDFPQTNSIEEYMTLEDPLNA